MNTEEQRDIPVKAKALLIDPETMVIVWLNESAAQGAAGDGRDVSGGVSIESVVPMAESLGVSQAVRDVASTGEARHLQTNLVSNAKGSMVIVISIYRMPDDKVLLLVENAWQPKQGLTGARRTTGRTRG